MSQVREPGQGRFNLFKVFVFSKEMTADYLTTSLKAAVLILLVASTSLALYSAFTSQSWWFLCPDCHGPARTVIGQTCETEYYPGDNSGPTNISHIIFGIGGSKNTWKDRKHYSELWWQSNITRGYTWLDGEPNPNTTRHEDSPPYRVSEDWSRFKHVHSASAVRIARIVVETFMLRLPDTRWFVMGDDDTVFFTDNLVTVLGKYDHRQMYYIGGNSESVEQDVMHSYGMAFGGGGFAVSYPLAAELVNVMDGCLDRYYNLYGSDQRVWACVAEVGVSLTRERGFHQIDIRGDPLGILAAHPVAPLVSLHHLDHVKPLFPNQTHFESVKSLMQAYWMDPARTMQQCFCYYGKYKWSVSISWGYVVQVFPSLLRARDLETPLQTFQTWRSWSNGPFTFNTRPLSRNPCEQPVIFYLDGLKEVGNGETQTTYKKYVVRKPNNCDKSHARAVALERIVVSASKMDPAEWNKAPRRQCCDITSLKSGILKVRIRGCKRCETITM